MRGPEEGAYGLLIFFFPNEFVQMFGFISSPTILFCSSCLSFDIKFLTVNHFVHCPCVVRTGLNEIYLMPIADDDDN